MKHDHAGLIRSLGEAYTAAWCSQDPDRVAAFYEEDGSLTVNEDPPAIGRAAIANVARGFMTGFPDMKVFLDRLVLENDGVIYHWTLTGTNNGPGGTGRKVHISGSKCGSLERRVLSPVHKVTLIALSIVVSLGRSIDRKGRAQSPRPKQLPG